MENPVIRVENLGKIYRIGEALPYRTLCDSITNAFTGFFRKLKNGSLSHKESSNFFWALKDIAFEVKKGEVMGIIGRNGAGKSTLLKILSRITNPTEGYALVRGQVSSLLEIGIGFHPELTGRDNIYFNGAVLGMRKKEIRRKFDEIVSFAEIEKFIDTPVKHYSSGMFVRLAFSVAAFLDSEILLVDEVLAVGDLGFQKKCLGKMDKIAGQGKTVLFVSHNMSAIQGLCTSAILLDQGQKIHYGPVDEVVKRYIDFSLNKLDTGKITASMHLVSSESIAVDSVIIMNKAGESISSVKINESFRITLRFSVKRPIQGVRVGMGVYTVLGIHIASLHHTDEGQEPFAGGIGQYEIDFYLKNPFLPNTYIIGVGAHSILGGAVLDYVREALKFDVVELSDDDQVFHQYQLSGLVHIRGNWSPIRKLGDKPAVL